MILIAASGPDVDGSVIPFSPIVRSTGVTGGVRDEPQPALDYVVGNHRQTTTREESMRAQPQERRDEVGASCPETMPVAWRTPAHRALNSLANSSYSPTVGIS